MNSVAGSRKVMRLSTTASRGHPVPPQSLPKQCWQQLIRARTSSPGRLPRSEGLFYCQDGRAFICEMSVAGDWVSRKSIKKWDDSKKITEGEREVILKNLDKFVRTTQGMTVSFIDK